MALSRARACACVFANSGAPPPRCAYISREVGARLLEIILASPHRMKDGIGTEMISGSSGPPRLNRTTAILVMYPFPSFSPNASMRGAAGSQALCSAGIDAVA